MFVPLHVKSDYSLGYGTASVDELVERAAALGYSSLALTDLENLYGQVRFHHACRARGLRPITGVELRPGFDGRRNFGRRSGRIVLLAENSIGYRSLCRIISGRRAGVRRGERDPSGGDPLLRVAAESEGLFILSDDPDVLRRMSGEKIPPERLGLLLIRPEDPQTVCGIREAARQLRFSLVADLDVVFPEERDHALHVLEVAIHQGKKMKEAEREGVVESRARRLRSPPEAEALFADCPEAIAGAGAIARACRFDLTAMAAELPSPELPPGENIEVRLRRTCEEAAAAMGDRWTGGHRRRLDRELAVLQTLKLSGFILIIAEILAYCRGEGIPAAARGSAVSSLTLYLLGASPVDPMAHGLLFERFLHTGKSELPDVDLDLPWHRRDEVIDWVYRRFGQDRVAMVAAHHAFQRRAALREGLKAWGARPVLIAALARELPPEDLEIEEVDFIGLGEALKNVHSVQPDIPGTRSLGHILPLVQRLIGRPRHIAAHPGGIVITKAPIRDLLPLERAPKGVVITQYDLAGLAALRFVKIDLLGNRCLSELEETLRLAFSPPPRLEDIPAEDPATLALIDRAESVGCFQLESPAMRSLLARIPIRRQSDVTAALALIRPGAAAGEAKALFIRRARGEIPYEAFDPVMADRLGETHGMLLYEEDIMELLSRIGGLSLGEADELRAAIIGSRGDAAVLGPLAAKFLEGAVRANPDESTARAKRAWEAAARFAAYSFNKAHAASYSVLAYLSAYMKAHHLVEFACALLNHHQGFYPLRAVAGELARLGVNLLSPDVNRSQYASCLEGSRSEPGGVAVRVGLEKVKVLSYPSADRLLEERMNHGPFGTLENFLVRVRLPLRELTALVLSGACDGLNPLRSEDYPLIHEAVLAALKEGNVPAAMETLRVQQAPRTLEEDRRFRLYQALTRIRNELRYLEMHLLAHPMAVLRPEAERYGCVGIRAAGESADRSGVRLAAMVAALRRVPTREGAMQFVTFEDETGLLEGVVLPPVYLRLGEQITTPGPYLVDGQIRRRQGAVHLEVTGLSPFHKRLRPYGKGNSPQRHREHRAK